MTNSPKLAVTDFYTAFQHKDAAGMNRHYHADVVFEDPAFGQLNHTQVCAMWEMLCQSPDLTIKFQILRSDEKMAIVSWQASYTFGKEKRPVFNKVTAVMEFKDGLIISHRDMFNLYKWARQALGLTGLLLGWTSAFKQKLNRQTRNRLTAFMEKKQTP